MSLFGKSFEKEIGKNTGKWVSNVVFGDGHSTPYRRAESRQQQKVTQQRLIEQKIHEQKLTQINFENKARQKEQLFAIDGAVIQNIDIVSSMKISNDIDQIIDLLSELAIQIKTNQWFKNNEEGKIRNKYNEAILEKYNQAFLRLKATDPSNYQIEYFEKILQTFKRKKILKKNKTLLVLIAILFVIFCIYLIAEGLFLIALVPIIVISIIIIGYKYYIDNKKANSTKTMSSKNVHSEKRNLETMIEPGNVVVESVFFDLNENGRIEKKLHEIWSSYKEVVDDKIINRKPIFSADGVTDSILFVGINPSFKASDDDTFIKSGNGNALLYGSFYELSSSPEYFNTLESFARKVGKGYTHINLLYAREDNRDLLLSCDQGFIREQLELSYETILTIKPASILFFSDYCKDLIFGLDRWVNPNSESKGHYILKGTNVPVFFTNDITSMTVIEQIELINKIRQSIKE